MEGSNGSCDLLDGDGNWFLTSVQVKKNHGFWEHYLLRRLTTQGKCSAIFLFLHENMLWVLIRPTTCFPREIKKNNNKKKKKKKWLIWRYGTVLSGQHLCNSLTVLHKPCTKPLLKTCLLFPLGANSFLLE